MLRLNWRMRHTSVASICRISSFVFLLSGLAACNTNGPIFESSKSSSTKGAITESQSKTKGDVRLGKQTKNTMARGKGRAFIGKPYKIKNRWYYPKEELGYVRVGRASWYGRDFHGRRTANGERFNMHSLTAAHPTMPLPSYARVTNLKNGSSVVVRVNDRGPFAGNRLIDVSKRTAEVLNFKHSGVASVKVEYLGRAPIKGNDAAYLAASYKPAGRGNLAVMAQNDADIDTDVSTTADGIYRSGNTVEVGYPELPGIGPSIEVKPSLSSAFAYEQSSAGIKAEVFSDILSTDIGTGVSSQGAYIDIGSFYDREEAEQLVQTLKGLGRIENRTEKDEKGKTVYCISLYDTGNIDTALSAAWSAGASEAFVVRTQ